MPNIGAKSRIRNHASLFSAAHINSDYALLSSLNNMKIKTFTNCLTNNFVVKARNYERVCNNIFQNVCTNIAELNSKVVI